MRYLQLLVCLIILLGANVESKELNARIGQTCAFLSSKIYCFGGTIIGGGSSNIDAMYSLDIFDNDGASPSKLNSQWEDVSPLNPTNIAIGRRWYPQAAVAPDRKRFLIQGGFNFDSKPNVHQTIAYNSETNSWETFANYNDIRNGGDRQMYFGSGEYIPSLDRFGFFGGRQAYAIAGSNFTTPDNTIISNLTYNDSDGNILSRAGFQYFTLFDIKANTWSIPLPQKNVPSVFRVAFSATFHPKTSKMFYLGGSYYDVTQDTYLAHSMSNATVFDTISSTWSEEFITGSTSPSPRNHHTATLLSNGDDILLYGGEIVERKALQDYCYTLNIPSMSWKEQSITSTGISGPRSQHSAVLVNDSSLFILFGSDINANTTNQLLVLDVRDANNIAFANNFPFHNSVAKPSPFIPGSPVPDDNTKKGLSKGSVAGIVVGCLIAVALVILGLVCCFRRKKAKQTDTQPGSSAAHSEPKEESNTIEALEVDWDKIDSQYKEVNFSPSTVLSPTYQQQKPNSHQHEQMNSPQKLHISDVTYSEADNSTVTSVSFPVTTKPSSPDSVKPSVFSRLTVKPDGGI